MMAMTTMMIIMMAMPLFCDAFSSPRQNLVLHHGNSVLPRNKYRIKSSDRCGFRSGNSIAAAAAFPSPPPLTELSLSAEDDDNIPTTNDTNDSDNNENDTTAPVPIEEKETETEDAAYDFNAGFKARVQQEGGKQTLQRKVVTTKAQKAASSTTQDFVQSITQNPIVYGLVAFIVLVAIASLFTSPAPFEQSTNGEQLNFGVR